MKRHAVFSPWFGLLFLIIIGVIAAASAEAALCRSKAAFTGDWADTNTWVDAAAPGNGDDVEITNAGSVVILSSGSSNINSLLVSRTLMFTNWNSILTAVNVTVTNNGVITLPGSFTNNTPSNNVYIVCTNLTVMNTGQINANGKGWAGGNASTGPGGYGPGGAIASTQHGASHGGMGGGDTSQGSSPRATYGDPAAPTAPGSGGGWWNGPTSHGGGAVRITAAETVTVNGVISANATDNADNKWGGGAGGSVWIAARQITGAGIVSANGGYGGSPSASGGNGGGGRVAVSFDPAAQAGPCGISFRAQPGIKATLPSGYPGTLWFTDTSIIPDSIAPSQFWGVVVSGTNVFRQFGALAVSNSYLRFAMGAQQLYVTNNLFLSRNGVLQLGGEAFAWIKGYYWYSTSAPSLFVGGNLIVESNSYLDVYGAITNAVPPYGATIDVGGSIVMRTNAAIYCWSHYTNGGSPIFRVTGNVTVDTTSVFNASERGYASYPMAINSGLRGYGPGGGLAAAGSSPYNTGGASHGGTSAWNSLPAYGSSNAPIMAGSGGGGYPNIVGGRGGSVVWIDAAGGTITLDGSISANGKAFTSGQSLAGGAGGSIYLVCRTFAGSGAMQATGGSGAGDATWRGYGSAGGRIAVWRVRDTSDGQVETDVSGGAYNLPGAGAPYAQSGTVVWGNLGFDGTMFIVR